MIARPWLYVVSVLLGLMATPAVSQDDRKAELRSHLAFDASAAFTADSGAAKADAAHAEEPATNESGSPGERQGEWQFTLAPYLWATSLRAETELGPLAASSEACFSDLLRHLDGAAQLRFEGMKDHWGFYLDGTYLRLSEEATVRVERFRVRGFDVEMDITEAWLDFGAIYRFGGPERAFDLMAGGRYAYVSSEVSVGPFLNLERSEDSVAPVVGARAQFDLSERWLLSLKADVGGFGVGDAADLTWGATGLLGYRLSDRVTLGFGYRLYQIDYSSGPLDLDLQYHGPMLGLAFTF